MACKKRQEMMEFMKYRFFAKDVFQKAMNVYIKLPKGKEKDEMRQALREYLYNNNYSCIINPERPLSPEYKMLIRDDCNGAIRTVDKDFLSFHYRYALKNAGIESCDLQDYRKVLLNTKAWQEMRKFPTYFSVEENVLNALYKQQLPIQLVKGMQINDFRDFVRNNCLEKFSQYRKRKSFIKTFINAKETEFRRMLGKAGVDIRYIDALVDTMKKKGEACNVKVYDENGRRIEGPEFTKHHTTPVYSPNNISSLNEINSFNRLSLVEKETHGYLHLLERAVVKDDMLYFEKMIVPEHASCILDFENYIAHDFKNTERKLSPLRPKSDNLNFLKKIALLTYKYSSIAENVKKEKTSNKFKHNGRNFNSRGGR